MLEALAPRPVALNFAYDHTANYLLSRWVALGLYTVRLTVLTCRFQRREDVGTFVNGQRISGPNMIKAGWRVRLGDVELVTAS